MSSDSSRFQPPAAGEAAHTQDDPSLPENSDLPLPPAPVKFLGSQMVTTDESSLIGTFYSAKGGPDYRPALVRACNSHAALVSGVQVLSEIEQLVESFSGGNPQVLAIRELVRTSAARAALASAKEATP
jgi:hypothetical protein